MLPREGSMEKRFPDTDTTESSGIVSVAAEGAMFDRLYRLDGWKTLSMVQRYAHPSPGHQRQAIERLVTRPLSTSPATPHDLGSNRDGRKSRLQE